MKKLSRGAIAALTLAAVVPAGFAIAKTYEHASWHRMSPETRARLEEGRLAMAKTALKLTAEQEPLWAAVETEIRAAQKMRNEKRDEFRKMREERKKDGEEGKAADGKRDMSERFERMSQHMGERADRMKAFSAAFKPFYAALSVEQKEVLRPLVREMMRGGRGHGGARWAFGGGWGGHHGWGHDGGRGGSRHHGERGGATDGGGGGRGADSAPPAPQNAPVEPDDDDGSSPSDNL